MTQPKFVPSSDISTVRASQPTSIPEIGRTKKAGLLGRPVVHGGSGQGTPGPDGGYALTLAERALADVHDTGESHHDLIAGVAALAAKRAGLVGRAPTRTDVEVAMDLFALRGSSDAVTLADRRTRFAGVGHSYFLLRSFVDDVDDAALRQRPGSVVALAHFPTN